MKENKLPFLDNFTSEKYETKTKRSTLRTLIKRAYLICSTKKYLEDHLKHSEYVFEKHNNFPIRVIDVLLDEGQSKVSNIRSSTQENQNGDNSTSFGFVLAGSKSEKLINSMKNSLKCVLPNNVSTRVTYSRQGISSDHLTFCLIFVISTDRCSTWSKAS